MPLRSRGRPAADDPSALSTDALLDAALDAFAERGRHDEPGIHGGEPGDPGLAGGPGSISWEINGDLASLSAGGMAAIIMEVLHPSVMAGVFEQSSYETQPFRRAQNTLGTSFAPRSATPRPPPP